MLYLFQNMLLKKSSDRWFEMPWRYLMWRHCNTTVSKLDFGISNGYLSNKSVDICFAISHGMQLNKLWSGWWFETFWRIYC